MPNSFFASHPVRGSLKRVLRLPIFIYRHHLGWLLGKRLLMLTTTGRKTGLPRDTVLEVVYHDATKSTYYIASGWGDKSDWYRNIHKTPQVKVSVGSRQYNAIASELSPQDAAQVLYNYTQKYPLASRLITRLFLGERLQNALEQSRAMAGSIPLVALKLVGQG